MKADAEAGRVAGFQLPSDAPKSRDFLASGEAERFTLEGADGDRLNYLVRRDGQAWSYTVPLEVGMKGLSNQIAAARDSVRTWKTYNLKRGFNYTYAVIAIGIWLSSLALLVYLARRISRPIQQLTEGLFKLASGELDTRVVSQSDDEIGRAIQAFNHMASQLRSSRDRLVYLTQLASWLKRWLARWRTK